MINRRKDSNPKDKPHKNISGPEPEGDSTGPRMEDEGKAASLHLIAAAFVLALLAVGGAISLYMAFQGAKQTQQEAEAKMAEAEAMIAEAEKRTANVELLSFLLDYNQVLINWVTDTGAEKLFYCRNANVDGPFDAKHEFTWHTAVASSQYETYEIGSYEDVGEQRFYSYCADDNDDRLYVMQLLEFEGQIYRFDLSYREATDDWHSPVFGREWTQNHGSFDIDIDVLRGQNYFNEQSTVRYDAKGVLNFRRADQPCGCRDCCCEVCQCNT